MDTAAVGASIWFTFALVLARCSGVLLALPSWDARVIPWTWRAVLAVGLAVLLTPSCLTTFSRVPAAPAPAAAGPQAADSPGSRTPMPGVATELGMLGAELLTGLVMGFGILLLLWGIQMAGQLVSQMAGLPAADSGGGHVEPVSAVTRLLDLFALALFLASGSHRGVIRALLDTFDDFPLGRSCLPQMQLAAVVRFLTHSFEFGLRTVLPMLAALLVSSILAGMLGRVMPQFNVLLLTCGWNSLLLLAALAVSLGAMAWSLQAQPLLPVQELLRPIGADNAHWEWGGL